MSQLLTSPLPQAGEGPECETIALDWSGALWPYAGVAVATCTPDGHAALVPAPARAWSRGEAVAWLTQRIRTGPPALIGFDFAFGLPCPHGVGYLDGRVPEVTTAPALWVLVEAASGGAADFAPGAALDDPRLGPSFWRAGKRPIEWDETLKRRDTERAAAALTGTHPVSVLNLAAAAKQVGKGSLAGMRALRALKQACGDKLSVWPFEPVRAQASVAVEIFPTLFRKRAGAGLAKLTDAARLGPALAAFDCRADLPERFDDHAGDALISAAGLHFLWRVSGGSAFAPTGLGERAVRAEGWIFGVGA